MRVSTDDVLTIQLAFNMDIYSDSTIFTVTRPADQPPPTSKDRFVFKNRTRFIILVVCTLCLSIAQSDTLTLNFTFICMAGDPVDIGTYNSSGVIHVTENGTYYETGSGTYLAEYEQAVLEQQRYAYTPNEKNMLFSIVAVGAMVAVYPVMWLIQKFGSRSVVTFFGFFSALCTALIPLCAYLGFYWIVVMRFFQGTGLSTGFTLIGIVTRHWSMQKQNAFYIAFLTCFFQIGPIFTMPVAGALCTSSLGWPSVYYLHAFITVLLFVLFLYFYRQVLLESVWSHHEYYSFLMFREQPDRHYFVSVKELDRIKRGKGDSTKKEPVPFRAIVTSNAIIAVWISAVANFMGIQVTMQFSPTYLNKVMGFPVEQTGVFSAIPQIVTFVLKMFAGVLADKATCCAPVTSVKIFNLLAIGGMGITFFALAFIPTSMPTFGLVMLICCCSIVGFNCGAFFRSSAIVAAQHNHFVMGVNSFINCMASLLAPVVVNIFVRNDTWDEWWYVWIVHGIVMTLCNIYFMFFGKGEPAEWTKSGYGAKVQPTAPALEAPPRSHPRDARFSMRLNDKISVSVQTVGLSRCDTCRASPPSPDSNSDKADTSPILTPRKWVPVRKAHGSCNSLEDYLSVEADQIRPPPRSHHSKIILPDGEQPENH
ncbi:transporter, major facilitator family protein [Necator americanus]|uniref:Transporter, major facilitator family protein n=1 Tax=Necator americanus TaxID=51031 RepID=W2TJQ4_NECAM|nr:transporter, major facilitator family protein [Necator americanus]ETN82033.1 transporter, major facilitator family protein [Necator americanus]